MSATLCRRLAAFTAAMTLDDVPVGARDAAARLLADTLACAIAAAAEPQGGAADVVREYALQFPERGEATLVGASLKSDVRNAALVNCTMARFLDANDIYMPPAGTLSGSGHFSDATMALIATAELAKASGAQLLEALVAAYELQAALAESFAWLERGFHSVSQVTVATALAAGKLNGLQEEQLAHAAALAVTTGLFLQSWLQPSGQVTALKNGAPGLAAERGILCAGLAAMGFRAPLDALETFFKYFGAGDPDPSRFERLGAQWTVPRNAIKPAPAQIFTQAIIQCAVDLYAQGLRLERLDALTVYSNQGACGRVQGSPAAFKPASREAADHSTPFVVAMALRDGLVGPETYARADWLRPDLRAAMVRMTLVVDPVWDAAMQDEGLLGGRIAARDRDGHLYESEVRQFRGHPDNPLGDDELVGKLEAFVGRPEVLGAGAGRRLLDRCLALAEEPDLEGLIGSWALRER
jgi:2-methylcitrate dehydratase